jgi:hypothetical protein
MYNSFLSTNQNAPRVHSLERPLIDQSKRTAGSLLQATPNSVPLGKQLQFPILTAKF